MLCLGIETSCDETALALVEDGIVRGHVLASQSDVHALFGGVVPELASREHYRFLGTLFDELMSKVNPSNDIDVIGVSRGPGLLGGLLTGVAFAKALAFGLGARLIGIDHLRAHLLVAGLDVNLPFPSLGLLVSGGHTQIYRMDAPASFSLLGRTLDDAAGEAFDKVGALLGMSYPCGLIFDKVSKRGTPDNKLFSKPYLNNDNLDFSFSGLKTAASQYYLQNFRDKFPQIHFDNDLSKVPQAICDFCASFTLSLVETLVEKIKRALDYYPDVKSLVLAGGVAANSTLREAMEKLMRERKGHLFVPPPKHCTDNAVMIAYSTWRLAQIGYCHDLDMTTIPKGTPIPEDMKTC